MGTLIFTMVKSVSLEREGKERYAAKGGDERKVRRRKVFKKEDEREKMKREEGERER